MFELVTTANPNLLSALNRSEMTICIFPKVIIPMEERAVTVSISNPKIQANHGLLKNIYKAVEINKLNAVTTNNIPPTFRAILSGSVSPDTEEII